MTHLHVERFAFKVNEGDGNGSIQSINQPTNQPFISSLAAQFDR